MSNQRIDADSDGSEVLNVRWANDDPNPAAVRRRAASASRPMTPTVTSC